MITEKTHPIERKWLVKSSIMSALIIISFLAVICLSFYEEYNIHIFPTIFIIGSVIAPFLSYFCLKWTIKNYHYEFGDKFIILKQGVISKSERSVFYGRIQNICIFQSLGNRILGLASLSIETASEGAGAKLMIKDNGGTRNLAIVLPGFASNHIGLPGLSYKNALSMKAALQRLIKNNPIDDAQSGL